METRFGVRRAMVRFDHDDRVRYFKRRQRMLATLAACYLAAFAVFGVSLFAVIGVLFLSTSTGEGIRMRGCGRYWQCKRSLETVGI